MGVVCDADYVMVGLIHYIFVWSRIMELDEIIMVELFEYMVDDADNDIMLNCLL